MYDGFTLEFTDRDASDGQDDNLMRVPRGCEVRRMDDALFRQCADREYYATIFGGAEQALTQGIGYCLLRGDEIACEAFAGPTGLGMIEISVTTHEPYRRQGYAACTCAHLIKDCEARGLQTYWNCAKQNLPSAALAHKLGYRAAREYHLLAWFQSPSG
jgi:RimJ/RimL family protein N-acetyltransferase